jgi:DNA-binding protein HU-beta
MVQKDLNAKIAAAMPELSKKQAKAIVDLVFGEIKSALKNGEAVLLTGFGKFYTKMLKAKVQKIPGSGKTVNVPARKVARFKAGKGLKEAVR